MKHSMMDGKYTVVFEEKTADFYAERYGVRWRELSGDGMILAMLQEIDELKTHTNSVQAEKLRDLMKQKYEQEVTMEMGYPKGAELKMLLAKLSKEAQAHANGCSNAGGTRDFLNGVAKLFKQLAEGPPIYS